MVVFEIREADALKATASCLERGRNILPLLYFLLFKIYSICFKISL
jgi:hypothetical protein